MEIASINPGSSPPPQARVENDALKPISLLALIMRLAPVLENQVIFAGDSLKASSQMSEDSFISSKMTTNAIDREAPFLKTEEILGIAGQVTAVVSIPLVPLTIALGGLPDILEVAPLLMQTANTVVQTVQSGLNTVTGSATAIAQTSVGVTQQQVTNSRASSSNLTLNSSADASLMSQTFGANQSVAKGVHELIEKTGEAQRAYKV
jgi:hypothetical protein